MIPPMIRPATIHDVPRIGEIINSHAELGKMLFKSYAQLYEDLRDFAVLEREGEIVGCPKREGCDEIAMVRVLEDVPAVELPAATPTPRGVSIPVLESLEE